MLKLLLGVLNPLTAIGNQLTEAYRIKTQATNNADRIQAEKVISTLEARRNVLLAEQGHWETRWIRPALALPVVVLWWKLIIWDTVLGWGSTPDPGQYVMWLAVSVPNVYFLMRPIEKWRRRPQVPPSR